VPKTIAVIAPRRERKAPEKECVLQARAELVSLGGAVLLSLCMIITAVFIMVMYSPGVTGIQRLIGVILFVGVWAYFLNSVTERLSLCGSVLTYTSLLNRTRSIPLDDLDAMILTHEGLNLERGIESIELRRPGKRPDKIPLGPCWQRNKLEGFLRSVDRALRGAQIFIEEK
jgi:hypothetical protein